MKRQPIPRYRQNNPQASIYNLRHSKCGQGHVSIEKLLFAKLNSELSEHNLLISYKIPKDKQRESHRESGSQNNTTQEKTRFPPKKNISSHFVMKCFFLVFFFFFLVLTFTLPLLVLRDLVLRESDVSRVHPR